MTMSQIQTVVLIPGAVLLVLGIVTFVLTRFLYVCRPDEILIFSGGKAGVRVLHGGRGMRVPFVERVERMDVSLISVPMTVQGAYSEGGIPLKVSAVANVKVASDPVLVGNAIERFLGRGRDEIARVCKETLEGHLRGVLATLTPEEVNEDRLKFANQLSDEAEKDLAKLGLRLDTLKIQHVADSRDYLESIGRKRIAEIIRDAEVAESDAIREAEESESVARARAEVAKTNAQAVIQKKQNELRQIKADLDAQARTEEERAIAAAQQVRATAEQELQKVRAELEQIRLAADVTIPAEVKRKVRELHSAGQAASISADGEAMAQALAAISDAWNASRGQAMEMYVLQNLEEIFGHVAVAAGKLDVGEVNLVDSGDGSTLPAYLKSYPAAVGSLLEQISTTLGVDIAQILGGSDAAATVATQPQLPVSQERGSL